jgi:hypothetical protein
MKAKPTEAEHPPQLSFFLRLRDDRNALPDLPKEKRKK